MQDYHVVVYASQEGRVIHPEYVVERPNLSQDTRVTEYPVEDGNLNIIIWWMYDMFTKTQQKTHLEQIIREVKQRVGSVEA